MSKNPLNDLGSSLGEYLREQRTTARLSLRQLSELAGVSNPYLSQIERGLKRPSAEILQQLAKGLEVSAESLYVKAGILDAEVAPPTTAPDVRDAIAADPALTPRQRKTLLDIYESYVEDAPTAMTPTRTPPEPPTTSPHPRTTTKERHMPVIEDLKKTVDTTPFFAVVGATDLAVEKVREARLRADKARADFAVRADKARTELSADLAPANVQARATKVADQVQEIPALALNQTLVVGGKFAEGVRRARHPRPQAGQAHPEPEGHQGPRGPGRAPPSPRSRVPSPPPARRPPTSSAPPRPPSPPPARRPRRSSPSSAAPSSRRPRSPRPRSPSRPSAPAPRPSARPPRPRTPPRRPPPRPRAPRPAFARPPPPPRRPPTRPPTRSAPRSRPARPTPAAE